VDSSAEIRTDEGIESALSLLPVCSFDIGWMDRLCLGKLMRPDEARPPHLGCH
jgi:hypothetical protein